MWSKIRIWWEHQTGYYLHRCNRCGDEFSFYHPRGTEGQSLTCRQMCMDPEHSDDQARTERVRRLWPWQRKHGWESEAGP